MEKLSILSIFLLVTTLAVPTWGRMRNTKIDKLEMLDEMIKVEILREKAVAAMEEQPLKARLHGCAGVGENCVHVPCCPTSSAGNIVECSRGPYNAVCIEYIPGPDWPQQKSSKI